MDKCKTCSYYAEHDGEPYCKKIAEKLLGLKGCGNHVVRSPFDGKTCSMCGKGGENNG